MEIIVGKTAGFCFGVKNAVDKTEELLEKDGDTYCLGELVHNSQVMKDLSAKGLHAIDTLEEVSRPSSKVIIRAHGVPPKIYEEASLKGIKLVDFTCPKVAKIHDKAKKYIEEGSYIFILGAKNHPEIIGTYGYCDDNASVIETAEDIEDSILKFEKSGLNRLAVIAQTTFSVKRFDEIVEKIEDGIVLGKGKFNNVEIKIDNTICNATFERQDEVESLSGRVDLMIIVGGKNSSNTKKLYELSLKYCKDVILVETADEIDLKLLKGKEKVGIMAGASTPMKSIEEVVEVLNGNS